MEKIEVKKRIIEEGKMKHQSVIDDFRLAIRRMREDTGFEEGTLALDEQGSIKEQTLAEISRIADELNFAVSEMDLLNRINTGSLHDEVNFGSVVVTDKSTFFISVSIEDFEANGQEIIGISTETPLYAVMKGLKKGDSFSYNQTTYHIEDVF